MTGQMTTVADGFHFLEAPRWHDGRLWFSDFYGYKVRSMREDGSDVREEATVPGQPSGLGWLPDGRLLVVSMRDRKILRREPDGTLSVHADLSPHATGHTNDMVVDAQGRAYVGNFGFDLMAGDPIEHRRAAPRRPRRHGHRGGRRPLVPQRQRDHRRQRAPGRGDVRQPGDRVRRHRRRRPRQPAGLGRVRAAADRTRRRRVARPAAASPATAPASTPRARCGSPTPSATG